MCVVDCLFAYFSLLLSSFPFRLHSGTLPNGIDFDLWYRFSPFFFSFRCCLIKRNVCCCYSTDIWNAAARERDMWVWRRSTCVCRRNCNWLIKKFKLHTFCGIKEISVNFCYAIWAKSSSSSAGEKNEEENKCFNGWMILFPGQQFAKSRLSFGCFAPFIFNFCSSHFFGAREKLSRKTKCFFLRCAKCALNQ